MNEVKSLPKDSWMEAADRIREVAELVACWLVEQNFEGQGKQDAEEFTADMQLAYMAMCYVAEFASDKCRFLVIGGTNE